ncbi:hypothetical protein [Paenibacillus sp. UNC499MF]|uniref:hypothetical protein n=1 Tax=Paenibacillus sp. UNC499MF TaxID=1502751 RepID=UPI0008A05D32|nr:hypothetical protein [Paenibacillus sp. UNC499MF]SEG45882.1 hypothetical protein SAMN02799616_03072 [Paenibacillus sp. UNC499MF]
MDAKEMEEQLIRKLTEGEMEEENKEESARKRLPAKTEIRIQATIDPVVEETRKYREMAEELDGRYDKYTHLLKENRPDSPKDPF